MTTSSGAKRMRISVVMNTLNEERRLPYALRSVRDWVDEIIVVDMYSDDRTAEIAEAFGARVFMHDRVGYADPARAYALARATADWIFILDADELVPPRLAGRLRAIVAADDVDVVDLPWLNYLLGAPLSGAGWGPTQDHHQRFFRAGWVEATGDVHAFLRVREGARVLRLPPDDGLAVVHFNYTDCAHFIEKLNRYTSIEAVPRSARPPRIAPARATAAAIREFTRRFLSQGGYRDGWRGFYLAGLMAFYRFSVYAKIQELVSVGNRSEIEAVYDAEAERWLNSETVDASLGPSKS